MTFVLTLLAASAPVLCQGYATQLRFQGADDGLVVGAERVSAVGESSSWFGLPLVAQQGLPIDTASAWDTADRLASFAQAPTFTISSALAPAASIKGVAPAPAPAVAPAAAPGPAPATRIPSIEYNVSEGDVLAGPFADGPLVGLTHVRSFEQPVQQVCPTKNFSDVCRAKLSNAKLATLAACEQTSHHMLKQCCVFCAYSGSYKYATGGSKSNVGGDCVSGCPGTVIEQLDVKQLLFFDDGYSKRDAQVPMPSRMHKYLTAAKEGASVKRTGKASLWTKTQKQKADTVASVFAAFAQGKFKGTSCKENAAALFTPDIAIDNRGPKDIKYFKKYSNGIDAACEYFGQTYGYSMHSLKATLHARGDEMVQVLKYKPGKGKILSSGTITQFNVIRFNKEGTKFAGFDTFFDNPTLYDELTGKGKITNPSPSRFGVLGQVLGAFGKGKFNGTSTCKKTAASFFTSDILIDFRGGGKKDVDYFKKYPAGFDGLCDWYAKQYKYVLHDLTASMYSRGNEEVTLRLSYRPQIYTLPTYLITKDTLIQVMVVKYNKEGTKIAGIDHYFDQPQVWDELYEMEKYARQTPQERAATAKEKVAEEKADREDYARKVAELEKEKKWKEGGGRAKTIAAVFRAFAQGKLKGSACKKNAASLFTADAVIDNRGPATNPDYFKKYSAGIDGVCELYAKTYGFHLHDLKTALYARGNDMVHVLRYTPGTASGQKASKSITQFNVIRFNRAATKFAGYDVFYDNPSAWDELTVAAAGLSPAPAPVLALAPASAPAFAPASAPALAPATASAGRAGYPSTLQMGILSKVLHAFKAGKFKDAKSCERESYIRFFFSSDAVIDLRGGGTKDTDYFKKYPAGIKGVCEWYSRSYQHHLSGLSTSMYQRGDKVMLRLSYRPQLPGNGPTTKATCLHQQVVKFNKEGTKIMGIDNYFDQSTAWDEFFDLEKAAELQQQKRKTLGAVFSAFGQGKFKGSRCKTNAASLFTTDAVVDSTGPAKNKGYFKKYAAGLDGVCEHFGKAYAFVMNDVKSTIYARGKDLVQVLRYTPGIAGGRKASSTITQFNVMKFNTDGTRLAGCDTFYDNTAPWDELTEKGTATYPSTSQMGVLGNVLKAFGAGKFKDRKACEAAAALFYTPNAVIDFRGGGTKDGEYFRKYPAGFKGVCDWYANSHRHILSSLTGSMYQRGDKVLFRFAYRPQVLGGTLNPKPGAKTKGTCLHAMVVKYNKQGTKIAGIENYFDQTTVWDEFFELEEIAKAQRRKPDTIAAVFKAFGQGKFTGQKCQQNAASLFTADAVIDSRGPQKNLDYFKTYAAGLEGVCEHFGKAYAYALYDLKASMYARGDDVVHVLRYTPGIAGRVRGASSKIVTQFNVVKFSSDGTKFARMESFYDNPAAWDELTGKGKGAYPTSARMGVLGYAMDAFADNKFNETEYCKESAASFYTNDTVIDFRGGGTKDVDYFKKYPTGLDGVCEWYVKSYRHTLNGLSASMYQRGDAVLLRMTYRPQVLGGGKIANETCLQQVVVSYNKEGTKIIRMDNYFDQTSAWDQLYDLKQEKQSKKRIPEADCSACGEYSGPHGSPKECGRICLSLHSTCTVTCLEAWDALAGNELDKCLQRCPKQVDTHLKSLGKATRKEKATVLAKDVPFPSKVNSTPSAAPNRSGYPSQWQVAKAKGGMNTASKLLRKLDKAGQLLTKPIPEIHHKGPLPAKGSFKRTLHRAALISSLGDGSTFKLGLESSRKKSTIWEATDFKPFAQYLTQSGMPRIGLIELNHGNKGYRIAAVLFSLPSHAKIWRGLYKAAFSNLRKRLPAGKVQFMTVQKYSDLTAEKIYNAAKQTSFLAWDDEAELDATSSTSSNLRGASLRTLSLVSKLQKLDIKATLAAKKMADDLVRLHSYSWLVFRISHGFNSRKVFKKK